MRPAEERRPWPGLVERDGETHLRVTRGLVLSRRRTAFALLAIGVAFSVPDLTTVSPNLQLSVVHQGLLFGLAAVGLNLLLRHTKLVSFGHAAFFGTGAYTAAVLATHFDVQSMTLLLLAALVCAGLMAAAIGYLSLRHTGLYFSLLTLAFGQLLYALVQGQSYFGSSDGLPVRPGASNRPLVFGVALEAEVYSVVMYYITVVVILASLVVMWRLVNSPFGAALDAIGQERTRARFIGIPVRRYVWVAFVISGLYGGIAGALYGMVRQHVRPEPTLHFLSSGDILFMAILGGYETLVGPLVGGTLLVFLQDVGRDLTTYFDALTGLVLLSIVFGFPRGIVGSLQRGGRLRGATASFVADPTVVGDWVVAAGRATVSGVRVWARNLRAVVGVR